jgi:hypothetical protein
MSSERERIVDRLQEKTGEEFDNFFRLEEVLNDAQDAHGRPWALARLLEMAGVEENKNALKLLLDRKYEEIESAHLARAGCNLAAGLLGAGG